MNKTTALEDRVSRILSALTAGIVKYTDDLRIDVDEASNLVEVHLWVNQADMRVTVGSKGTTIQALEALLLYVAGQEGKTSVLRLEEAVVGKNENLKTFEPRNDFDPEPTRLSLEKITSEIFDVACTVTHKPTGKISTTFHVVAPAGLDETETNLVATSLNTLLHAVGKAKHGRLFFVAIANGDEHAQPKSAAGRFATETETR